MSKTSGADLDGPWPRRGPPGSPGAPGHEKSMGKKLVTVPGPDSAGLGGRMSKKPPKNFGKCPKISGSGTGLEIGVFQVSGALVKTPGAEKYGEQACNGPGARFLRFWA